MKLLKSLYIIWVVFWVIGAILAYFVAHNATFIGVLFQFILVCLFPLLPYFYYLIYEKTKTKNLLVAIFCYLLLFICIFYYFSLIYSDRSSFLEFFIIVTSYTIICIVVVLLKFKINLRLCLYMVLCVFTYLYIILHIFIEDYGMRWKQILLDKDVRIYIYKEIINLLYN